MHCPRTDVARTRQYLQEPTNSIRNHQQQRQAPITRNVSPCKHYTPPKSPFALFTAHRALRTSHTTLSMPPRLHLLHQISERILELPSEGILRVAIDGVDGAGKTTFADELADLIQ